MRRRVVQVVEEDAEGVTIFDKIIARDSRSRELLPGQRLDNDTPTPQFPIQQQP